MMRRSVSQANALLRVHVLIDSLTWGGAEMLLADLAAAAPRAGIALSVGYMRDIDGSPAATRLREHGVEPELVPIRRMLEPDAIPRLRRHLRQVRPDVVHTHLGLADVLGTLAARSLRLPSVSTIHLIARERTGRPADMSRRGIAKARFAAFARRHAADRVIAVSDAAREAYLQAGWDAPSHVVTVRNGIARAASPGAGAALRNELGIDSDALVASTVTVLREGKGHDVVFDAVQQLRPRFPKLRLIVLGDGPEREQIEAQARPLGATAIFTGHRADAMAVLAATDVLLHPTAMDAFPTALLEAAATRVPVIATAVGGIPEIVLDGETGFLLPFPPTAGDLAARLEPLLGDAALREQIGRRAADRFAQRFTADRWLADLAEVYRLVIEERRPARRRGEQLRLPGSERGVDAP